MKKIMALLLAALLIITVTGCGGNSSGSSTGGGTGGGKSASSGGNKSTTNKSTSNSKVPRDKNGAVIIKFPSYKTGNNVGAKFFLPQVKRFNDKYKGKYHIEIEAITQNEYPNKLKLLYQQKKLPPLIEIGGDKKFAQILIDNNALLDLKPYIDKSPGIKKVLIPNSIKYNTDKNGHIVSLPLAVERPIGLYYNKDLFKKAGIDSFPKTWDGFFKDLDKIKSSGTVPLSLMTGENAWTTMLIASAYLASQPDGAKILNTSKTVTDYNSAAWVKTITMVQKLLKKYTTPSALGAGYAVAANEFLSGKTAIIANGPWMVSDFHNTDKTSKGFAKKVGAAIYPGGIALGTSDGYWYSIPKGTPQAQVDGLIDYFKFIYSPNELNAYMVAEGGFAPKLPMPDSYKKQLDPILQQLNDATANNMKLLSRSVYDIAPQPVTDLFSKNLPLLTTGDMTPKQFCKALTDAAQKFKK